VSVVIQFCILKRCHVLRSIFYVFMCVFIFSIYTLYFSDFFILCFSIRKSRMLSNSLRTFFPFQLATLCVSIFF